MYLLELQPNGNIRLTIHLLDNEIPRYAILSHTWGDENAEVTFQDMVAGSGRHKAGFKKIKFCGEQAARDGLRYFWVDSCCIDKYSYTEVAVTINSMFQLYQNAVKCYVYLMDVPSSPCDGYDNVSQQPYETAFRASRWFKRGWTLQELLAPPSLEFFSREGDRLGDRSSLEQQVHEVTGINILALRGTSLSQFSIQERLSWTHDRKTKREEDFAYCLLGIFGVGMPLTYGEGRSSALKRLMKTINRSCSNESSGQSIITFSKYGNAAEYQSSLSSAEGVVFEGHYDWVNAITFAPNGDQLASASNDRTVRLWDTTTGQQIQQFHGHSQYVSAVAFSPNDKLVVLASAD
jgi:hypothetical protein